MLFPPSGYISPPALKVQKNLWSQDFLEVGAICLLHTQKTVLQSYGLNRGKLKEPFSALGLILLLEL